MFYNVIKLNRENYLFHRGVLLNNKKVRSILSKGFFLNISLFNLRVFKYIQFFISVGIYYQMLTTYEIQEVFRHCL